VVVTDVALANSGVLYEKGDGGETDYEEARRRYQMAADRGHPLAQYNLGMMLAYMHAQVIVHSIMC
jgi:TPR repeat protein